MRDFFDLFDVLIERATDPERSFRSTALTDDIGEYVVDTVKTPDCGWETGLQKSGRAWVIVEYYESEDSACAGHRKWCDFVKTEPKLVHSVQTGYDERL